MTLDFLTAISRVVIYECILFESINYSQHWIRFIIYIHLIMFVYCANDIYLNISLQMKYFKARKRSLTDIKFYHIFA